MAFATEDVKRVQTDPLNLEFVYDGQGRVEYQAEALPGTIRSDAGWRITRYFYTGLNTNPDRSRWAFHPTNGKGGKHMNLVFDSGATEYNTYVYSI
jgi:hypothetical protein